ncbi:MAG: hypothetical protein KY476_11175, partial [Planctomycetes bacterium]|nr:hypothetical protein [Planctomycetota bacterium]
MPISVTCPSCEAKLKVKDEHAGRVVPCPQCRQKLTIPDEPAAAAPLRSGAQFGDTFSADPLRASVDEESEPLDFSWETLRVGLRIVNGAAITGFCGTVGWGLATGLAMSAAAGARGAWGGPDVGVMQLMMFLMIGSFIALVGQAVVALTGWAVCRGGPAQLRDRSYAGLAVAAMAVAIAIVVALPLYMFSLAGPGRAGTAVTFKLIAFVAGSAWLAAYALFAQFTRSLGEHFTDPPLRMQSSYFLLYVAAQAIWMLVQLFLLEEGMGPLFGGSPGMWVFVNVVVGMIHFIWVRELA